MSRYTAGQVAAAAIEWAASGDPRPPEAIAGLSPREQAQLARAGHEVKRAAEDVARRVCGGGEGEQ